VIFFAGLAVIILAGCSNGDDGRSSEPLIVLSPQSGESGTPVFVSGENFPVGTVVMLRLGPPDVGYSPFPYASGVVGQDGRFTLTFHIPDGWPDGTPINMTELIVIALNEDGSVKATAPFAYLAGGVIEPSLPATGGAATLDPALVVNEEAIVIAVKNHLTLSGESTQVAVAVEVIEGEFARVGVVSLDPGAEGKLTGYLKLVSGNWEVLVVGRDFDSDQLLELGIPPAILPEEMLAPEG
jgi:hypothetical protein